MDRNLEQVLQKLAYIERYCGSIPVREQIDGQWQAIYLSDLPGHLAIAHVARLLREGGTPQRVLPPKEGGAAEGLAEALRACVAAMEASVRVGCTDHLDCWDDARREWYQPLERAKELLK